ncbi:DGQHR domain-containing protein [Fulvivirga ligni]|nr:DGQHR domain-containing protein [Fulvivirga ligni]
MKASDIVDNHRIITVSESEELYTTNINEILQREIKKTRIRAITSYITDKDERFLGCIVVAIHRGNPKWTEISIGRNFQVEGSDIDDSSVDFLSSKFGVLSLTGTEQIFALDGQHRLLGIRKSLENDPGLGDLEIPLIFVIHKHDNLERTRRLFTVLNKYAEKPKGAELIILDEDDAAAIVTRRLVSDHTILSKQRALSTSKSGNIPSSDNTSLTTLVTINAINKILFRKDNMFYTMRPSDNELNQFYEKAAEFWDVFFQVFPEIVRYVNGGVDVRIDNKSIERDSESGGSLLLRPVGQKLIAYAYSRFDDNERQTFIDKLRQVDFSLSGNTWKYLYWNEKMITGEDRLKKNLLMFLLGKFYNQEEIHDEMKRIYELNNEEYHNHIRPIIN